jgi:hypothetical protein
MIGFMLGLLAMLLDVFLNLISMLGPVALTLAVLLNGFSMSRLGMFSLLFLSALAAIYPRVEIT